MRILHPSPRHAWAVLPLLAAGFVSAQTTDTDPNAVPTLPPPAPAVPGAPAARLQPPPFPLPQHAPSASQPAGPGLAPGLREPQPAEPGALTTEPAGVQDSIGSRRP
ncbi:hypothetical protein IWX58_004068 [Rubrivivax gelatinosus]|uniref:hypothetical protein n=1 Tax=Rubrivivax gelatinosus TaxID=28068 RepID=UPI0018CB5FB7|nr:hypothetical protein [Rubrivivax gelatinosus]MBG6082381.1 hypothetical protein [Rubrivivax gelatinosus]